MTTQVDHAEIKLGQLLTMLLAVLAFVYKEPAYLIGLGAVFLVTGFYRPLSPFVLIYRMMVRPLGIMHSDYRLDNIQPHAFGQLIGVNGDDRHHFALCGVWHSRMDHCWDTIRSDAGILSGLVHRLFFLLPAQSTRTEGFLSPCADGQIGAAGAAAKEMKVVSTSDINKK